MFVYLFYAKKLQKALYTTIKSSVARQTLLFFYLYTVSESAAKISLIFELNYGVIYSLFFNYQQDQDQTAFLP